MFGTLKKYLKQTQKYLLIMIQLHSKSPTKEIKQIWEIFALGGTVILLLTFLSGTPFIFGISFKFPFSILIDNYGGFIFFAFIIIFCILFIDTKKLKSLKA